MRDDAVVRTPRTEVVFERHRDAEKRRALPDRAVAIDLSGARAPAPRSLC
jgi:hypothetical protein